MVISSKEIGALKVTPVKDRVTEHDEDQGAAGLTISTSDKDLGSL